MYFCTFSFDQHATSVFVATLKGEETNTLTKHTQTDSQNVKQDCCCSRASIFCTSGRLLPIGTTSHQNCHSHC